MPQANTDTMESRFTPYLIVIFVLAFLVPVLVLPGLLDNVFNTPKTLLMLLGASVMSAVYAITFLAGRPVPVSKVSTPKIILFLILLNFFSFFYTSNYHYTVVASVMNITGLLIFHFVSLYVDGKKAFWVIMITALSGLLVAIETWLQFFNTFILFKGVRPGVMLMGTIGNSNFLGAYLIFPLFATVSLIFLLKGKLRFVPLGLFIFMLGAFLFARARAGWMGFFLSLPIFLVLLLRIRKISIRAYLKSHPKQVTAYTAVLLVLLLSLWSFAPERFHSMMQFSNVTESETLRLRIHKYYRASFWLFKQSPLFGTGLWSYRNGVYTAQAEINEVDGNFFKNYPEPKPRRVHTDYLEILNDGGLMAATALLVFFFVVMRHGWAVIRGEEIDSRDRVITATAFCSLIAIMLAAFFFFPFRINSTLFMTVLMMGLVEGIYLRNHGLIGTTSGWKSEMRFFSIPMVLLLLVGLIWFAGMRPLLAELEHFKYKTALGQGKNKEAEKSLLKAIDYDPHNSAYCLYASEFYKNTIKDLGKARDFIERAIVDFNGDVTGWSIYYMKGLLAYRTGSLFEARAAFEKALYYNPTFERAGKKLEEVNKVIRDHDKVLIKLR